MNDNHFPIQYRLASLKSMLYLSALVRMSGDSEVRGELKELLCENGLLVTLEVAERLQRLRKRLSRA